jgi:hypothetical protein
VALQAGFTYLGLMILIATLLLATSTTLTLGSIAQRREAEQRLLEVGAAYRQAIASYLNSSPAGQPQLPRLTRRAAQGSALSRHPPSLATDLPRPNHRQGRVGACRGARRRHHGNPQPLRRTRNQDCRVRSGEPVVRRKTALLGMGLRCSGDACRRRGARRWRRGRTGANPAGISPQVAGSLPAQTPALFPGQVPAQASRLPSATNANAPLRGRVARPPPCRRSRRAEPAGPVRGWASGPRRQGNSYTVRAHCRGGILHLIKQWLKARSSAKRVAVCCGG